MASSGSPSKRPRVASDSGTSVKLTAEEATQYDRQIRLWGLEAQKRIRSAKVLCIGSTGIAIEVCKNIVLAGIESLVVLDPCTVTPEDLTANFYLQQDQIGQNRAEVSVPRLRTLNPNVNITADTTDPGSKTEEYYGNFDLVCVHGLSLHEMAKINGHCRRQSVKMFGSAVSGFVGFMFADLLDHAFAEERIERAKEGSEQKEDVTITVKREINFVSLDDAINVSWSGKKLSKHNSKLFFYFYVWSEYYKKYGRAPAKAESIDELTEVRAVTLLGLGVDATAVTDDELLMMMSSTSELGPVCAIVGGILSNEIIKALSLKGRPHNNFLFYNGLTTQGQVQLIGA